jgi:hypothetical protein
MTLSANLTSDVDFNGHIRLSVPLPGARKVAHSSGNTASEISFPCRQELEQQPRAFRTGNITYGPHAKERVPLFVEHMKALQ